jgi:hypothetical protein
MYAVYVGLNQWAVQRLKGLWEKLSTKWEKCYAELDQLCNPKSNSGAMRALLRHEHKWAWPAFDDARLLNLNKKRREADVLRCVHRCQRASTYSRRTPRSTASSGTRASRLTTRNSQRSRTSASRAARRPPTPSTATPCSLGDDLPTQ